MDKIFFTSSLVIIPPGLLTQADRYIHVNTNFIKSENKNQYITPEKWKGLQENDTDTECSPFLQVFYGARHSPIFFPQNATCK